MITLSYKIEENGEKSVLVKREVIESEATVNEKASATTIIETFKEALEKKIKGKAKRERKTKGE